MSYRPKPWYSTDHKPYLPETARAVRSSVEACANLRRLALQAAATMNYLYHREWVVSVLSARISDKSHQAPSFTGSHLNWWTAGTTPTDPTINITKSAVDSVSSSMFAEPPLIQIRPEGASFEQLVEWEDRELALNATMNKKSARQIQRKVGRDGLISGEGHVFPCYQDGDIVYRRLRFEQVLYDPYDAESGPPTYQHMVELADRRHFAGFIERLQVVGEDGKKTNIPDLQAKLTALEKATSQDAVLPNHQQEYRPLEQWLYSQTSSAADTDRVRIAHSWRRSMRDGMDDPDGRYIITLLDGTPDPVVLYDAPYSRTLLPVVSWSPFPGDGGIGGSGLVHLLQGWQGFIDRVLRKITGDQDRFGYIKLLVNKNEFTPKDAKAMLQYGIKIVGVSNPGTQPQWVRPEVLSGEDIQVLQLALDYSRSEYGINRMLTQGTSQLRGQVSGAAIVEEDAKTRDRLSDIREEYSDFRVRLAGATMAAIEDAIQYDPEFRAHFETPDGETITTQWSAITRVNGRYTLQMEEVGVLGRTRAGRMAKLMDLREKGAVPDDLFRAALMSSPDLKRLSRLTTSGERLARRHMRDILRSPTNPPSPSKDLDLPLALTIVTDTLRFAMSGNASMAIQQALRTYKLAVEGLMEESAPGPAVPMEAPPLAPPL